MDGLKPSGNDMVVDVDPFPPEYLSSRLSQFRDAGRDANFELPSCDEGAGGRTDHECAGAVAVVARIPRYARAFTILREPCCDLL
jgi:hypothetical protein